MELSALCSQGDPEHPICPVMLGDARLASQFANKMLGTFPVTLTSGKVEIGVQAPCTIDGNSECPL